VESWLKDWQAKNWKRKGGVLMNIDLWKEISSEIKQRKITWKWVRGHVGNPYNERVYRLAKQMMRARK
jgi:ribonuclease HI